MPPIRRDAPQLAYRAMIAICSVLVHSQAVGQGVLAPPPGSQTASGSAFRDGIALGSEAATLGNLLSPAALLNWGPVRLHPQINYRLSYGKGIQSRPNSPETTVINQLSPGVTMNLGSRWILNYSPTLQFYSSPAFRDTLEQSVSLSGNTSYGDWNFGFSQSYNSSSQPLIETGTQTDQEQYSTSLKAAYEVNSKASFDLGVNQDLRFTALFTDNFGWSTMNWFKYQISPAFGTGIGVGGGYNKVSVGSDTVFERLRIRATWRPGPKLTLIVHGGVGSRQNLNGSSSSPINPLYGIALNYHVFEPSTLTVSLDHGINSSLLRDQLSESTDVSASLTQRLFGKVTLGISGSYSVNAFQSTAVGTVVSREDSSSSFGVNLGTVVFQRVSASLFYRLSENQSSATGFSYSSSQAGLSLGYSF